MSAEQSRKVMRRITDEVFNQGKLNVLEDLVASDYVEENMPADNPFGQGREGFRRYTVAFREAFPDAHYEVRDIIAEGDKVVAYVDASGTFKGQFMGMEPTGKHGRWRELHMCRLDNGKLKECWHVADQMGMMQQLGMNPTPHA